MRVHKVGEAGSPLTLGVTTLQLKWETVHDAKRVLAGLDIQRVTTCLRVSFRVC